MTDEDKKRLLRLILTEISVDHAAEGITVEFKVRPEWEPHVEFVQANRRQGSPSATTSERKTGLDDPKRAFVLRRQSTDRIVLFRADGLTSSTSVRGA